MADRKIYFGAGPTALPETVLAKAAKAVISYEDTGLSILEIPHRGKAFLQLLAESKALVKELCQLDDAYEVLWLQGGGRQQFAMIPMNFLGEGQTAGYINSGHWSVAAMDAARYYGSVAELASSDSDHYTHLPAWPAQIDPTLQYLHFTTNNTIYGTQWPAIPTAPVPLIADMSSDIFSMQRPYHHLDLFYAVAQKNIGIAGVTLVVVRKEMLHRMQRPLPDALSFAAQVQADSLVNTAPVFAIYCATLMLRWIKAKGINNIEQDNRLKAALLYEEIDRNPAFYSPIHTADRSLMNVVFKGKDEMTEQAFLARCQAAGISGIAGHRSVGGFRASLYNAVTVAHVQQLIAVMQQPF